MPKKKKIIIITLFIFGPISNCFMRFLMDIPVGVLNLISLTFFELSEVNKRVIFKINRLFKILVRFENVVSMRMEVSTN